MHQGLKRALASAQVVSALVAKGADVNAEGENGETPLVQVRARRDPPPIQTGCHPA